MRSLLFILAFGFIFCVEFSHAGLIAKFKARLNMHLRCDRLAENWLDSLNEDSDEIENQNIDSDASRFAPPLPINIPLPKNYGEWLARPYSLQLGIQPVFRGEDLGAAMHLKFAGKRITYLKTFEEILKYQVFVEEGFLVNSAGERVCPVKCRGIFVMSPIGEIFFTDKPVYLEFHHSSFLAGAKVAAAGELKIKNGVLLSVNNRSGHYKPTYAHIFQFLLELKALGIHTDYNIEFYDLKGRYLYDYRVADRDKPLRKATLKKVSERPKWAKRHIGPLPWELLFEEQPK